MQSTRSLDRRRIADAIWPELLPSDQLKSLRPALHYARASIGDSALQVDDRSGRVSLHAGSDWEEAKRLELRIAAEVDDADRLMLLHALTNLVREPLFEGWDRLWMEPYRQRHLNLNCRAHMGLAELLASKGEAEMALSHVVQVRNLNSFDESAIKLQLQLLGRLGRTQEAREVYRVVKVSGPSLDVAAVASKAISGAYAGPNVRISSAVQLEFVQGLLEVLTKEAPERLLPLLAAQQVNWAVVTHGPELKSLLESVLARTSGWSEDRAGVAKRLLQYYGQEGEFQHVRALASQLLTSLRTNDQVAALNYLAMDASYSSDYAECEQYYLEAIDRCEREGLGYLAAVSRANLALAYFACLRLDEALDLLRSLIDELSVATDPNARYSIAHCLAAIVHIHDFRGEYDEEFRLAEDWMKLAQLDDAVRRDSAGLATISLAHARKGSASAASHAVNALNAAVSSRQRVKMHASALIVCTAARRLGLSEASIDASRELLAWTYAFRPELSPLERRMYADAGLVIEEEPVETPTSLPRIIVNLREALEFVAH